jgi:oligopeptide transport system permease protein
VLGCTVLVTMIAACVLTLPWAAGRVDADTPRRFEQTRPEMSLLAPRSDAWLGTDRLGRDVAMRCLVGGAVSLAVGLSAALIAACLGTIYGTIAGATGGRTDAVMMRIVDIFYGLPYILLVVLLAVAVEGLVERADIRVFREQAEAPAWLQFVQSHRPLVNVVTLLVAIGGVSWLTMARVIRGQVLSLRQQPFMEACRALGVPSWRQFTRHLLPNLAGPIAVYATLAVPQAILSESFLSFLGIGVREPLPSWGNLAADGLAELNTVRVRWWLLVFPCLLIAVTLLALNFVGEALRERLDPKRATA